MLPTLAASALAILLLRAALADVATRTLPDGIALLVAGLGVLLRAMAGGAAMLASLGTALLLFAALVPLARRGWLGGGDVKLAAALALALPPAATLDFLVATTIAGGVLGVLFLAGRHLAPRLPPVGRGRPVARLLAVEARRLRQGGPLPYGVALAAGGIHVLLGGG